MGISKVRLCGGQPYTFCYKGFDPGASNDFSNWCGGIDYGFYPIPRTLGFKTLILIQTKNEKYLLITLLMITVFSTVHFSCSDDFIDRPVEYSTDSGENYFLTPKIRLR
jgi:hypothetical protein